MPLLTEWSHYDHTQFERKKPEKQQDIPLENKILFETAAEEGEIQKLETEGKIDQRQKEALERAKECAHELFPDKPECQKDLFKLEKKEIMHQISIGEEMELLDIEMNPNNHHPKSEPSPDTPGIASWAKGKLKGLLGSKE
jgi:hypothetical protein